MGDSRVPIDEVVYFDFITSHPSTGAATDADSIPTFAVYEEATDSDIGIGGNATKRTSLTGNYRLTFTCSTANGFEAGKWYAVIASATVNSVAGKGVVAHFQVVPAESSAGVPKVDMSHVAGTSQTAGDLAALINTIDDFLDTEIAAIKAKTDNLPSDPADESLLEAAIAALSIPTAIQNADALLDRAAGVETGWTVRQALRIYLSALAAKVSGMDTLAPVFRDVGDTKNRITATTDADGNRTAVTLDAT